jgi:hypothetical protein
MDKLGRLAKVDLRKYFPREDFDFTKWLAEPDNLELLSDEIGIGIESPQVEADVGRFNVDILAQEENTERKIIIENQLEITDHSHLGQLITYAAGLEAEYIIWIVRDVKDEHRQAIDWLNEHTDEKLNFFLVAIELWQIGESTPAPRFNIICRPNDWKKSVQGGPRGPEVSETQRMQLEFWTQLIQYAQDKKVDLKLRSPRPQHWYDIPIGRSDCHATLTYNVKENKIGCEIYIPNLKELFRAFYESKDAIEKELNLKESIEWQELPNKKASRIRIFRPLTENKLNDAFDWLISTTYKLKEVFKKNWGEPPDNK